MKEKHGILGGSLLVAGTTIGGGMLALPVLTSPGGFIPSLAIYALCWLFMSATGLLFLEICLKMKEGVNIVSMAKETLGFPGKVFAWIVYLFLFYCLTLAYVVGCGNLLSEFFGSIPDSLGPILFVLLFAPMVYLGAHLIQKLNIYFMLAMLVLYIAFVFRGFDDIKPELLFRRDWGLSLLALPVAFTAFAYQGIIPTLAHYLEYDNRKMRLSIIIGSFIPLLTYIIWQWLILGIIPFDAPGGLADALQYGRNAVSPLKEFTNDPLVYPIGQAFAFLALLTSFFGVTLGMLDFLADGLKVSRQGWSRIWLCLMIFIPPLFIANFHPNIFLTALEYAGGFGCAFLLGLLPILMVYSARYKLNWNTIPQIPGGKVTLGVMTLFVLFEICFEIYLVYSKTL